MLYVGVIEDRYDPLKLGRCRVRVIGLHTHDASKLPTSDLPWAIPMQPITSAAISGIGQTPLGLVEGSHVVVAFQDLDNQYPIIIGSIGGIPQNDNTDVSVDDSTLTIKIDGEVKETNTQSASINSSQSSTGVVQVSSPLENKNALKRSPEFKASTAAIELIKRFEGLRLNSYQDSIGKWTIGYGTTIINGTPVSSGLTITKSQAESYLLNDLNREFVPAIHRQVRALITQSMFDALCCFVYNVGQGNLAKSTLLKDLNTSKYLDAAMGFMQWTKAGDTQLAGLIKRRSAEKDLFLADGVPNIAGELPAAVSSNQDLNNDTRQSTSSTRGFIDPSGKYPLYFNEPDTNRLARHEEINKTIVYKKEAAVVKGVQSADGTTWDQSPIPYNAQYPFNHVMQTESGHVLEFDDTPYSERIHLYHKSGTFTEIDANGTQVNRIVGDNYEILERNGYVQVNGSVNMTIDGAHNVIVKNAMNLNVYGSANITVSSDTNLNVGGSLNIAVGESFKVKAANIIMEATNVDIGASNNLTISGGADTNIKAGGTLYADGSAIEWANGANSAKSSGLSSPEGGGTSAEMPEFGHLNVITRGASAAGQYETPDEGDPTIYQQYQIMNGSIKLEDLTVGDKSGYVSAQPSNVPAMPASCSAINLKDSFDPTFMLSKNFTLSALTKNGSRPVVSQLGLSVQEIVCNLKGLAENCLEPIRNIYPNMMITSGFRRPGDVAASSKTSDHYLGCACDIIIPNLNRAGHYEAIQKIQQIIPYHQLLLEYQGASIVWIHISFKYTNRKQQLFTMKDHMRVSDFGQLVLVA